MKDEHKEVVGH